jgi:orotate phosphoribosyltransferase
VQVAPENAPFWYVSGLLGPYYVNSESLCGGRSNALEVLSIIDDNLEKRERLASILVPKLQSIYDQSSIYRDVIDQLTDIARNIPGINAITGGQRRDWVFGPLVAEATGLPYLYLYNDLQARDPDGVIVRDMGGARIVNIADLLTVGSSYINKWIPATAKINGQLVAAVNVIDRMQGGEANLRAHGIQEIHITYRIDAELFDRALQLGIMNQDQRDLALKYIANPDETMREFLLNNPDFLRQSLTSADTKTRERAAKLIGNNLYKLPQEYLNQLTVQ